MPTTKLIVLAFLVSFYAYGQCNSLSKNPITKQWDCIGGSATGSSTVDTVFGRTGAVAANTGDYTAAQVTNAVSTAGSYSDPSWITALAGSKITGNITGSAASLTNALTSTLVLFGQGTGVPATSSYFSWTDQTAPLPTGVLTIGSGTQSFQLAGRGTDSGVTQGVPYFRSATSQSNTAMDIFPNGNPAATASGTTWFDVCSNDLQPLNSDSWNCAIIGVSGYVFHINNGSLVQVVDSANTATFTTLNPHQLSASNSVVVAGGPTNLAGTYTVGTTPTSTTFTITTASVADGTYTTAGMAVSTAGSVLLGAHNTSNMAGSTAVLAGTSISFADRIGGTTRAELTGSAFSLGATPSVKFYFNSKTMRMASDFVQRWSSTTDPEGTQDAGFERVAAASVGVNQGTAGRWADLSMRHLLAKSVATYAPAPTITSGFGTSPTIAGSDAAGRVTVGTGGTAQTGTVTFGTAYATAPACSAHNETTQLVAFPTATTTTLVIASSTPFTAADKLVWNCIGY